MLESGNKPLRQPLSMPVQPDDGRDRKIFDRLDAEIAGEEKAEKERTPPARQKRKSGKATRAGYRGPRSSQSRPRPSKKPGRRDSEAFAPAKEMTTRVAHDIRRQYGDGLTRDEWMKLVSAFRAGVMPRRRAGRRPKAQVPAAV
jgi:hypothetical protein